MLDLLKSHTSVRRYTDEKISDEQLYEMLEAAQYAATSHFVQAYSVIHVKDEAKKDELAKLTNNEFQFKTAAVSLLFCADLKRNEKAVAIHDKEIVGNTVEDFLVASIDTALFAQNFVVAAESKGYGICYIGGARNNPKEISELFDLPEYVIPLFAMTVGVPQKLNEVKPRLPLESIVHVDGYDVDKYDEQLKAYDEEYNDYVRRRTSNKKDIKWSETMADFWPKVRRGHLKEFVQEKGYLTED